MFFARSVFPTQMIKFKLESHPFLLAFCQLFCECMHFFEQFFEAFFVIFIFIDKDLYVLVSTRRLSCYCLNFVPLRFSFRNRDGNEWFYFFQIAGFSFCQVLVGTD